MNGKNRIKILIGVLCVVLVLLATAVALILDSRSPDPVFGIFQTEPTGASEEPTASSEGPQAPTETTAGPAQETVLPTAAGETQSTVEPTAGPSQEEEIPKTTEEQLNAPPEQAPSVVIPPAKDPQTGEEIGISFPCQIPGYDMTVEKLAPYSGMFVEDGSNGNVENVAMLLVKNDGDFPVEYTQIRVECGQEELLFDISALPAGEKLVVQEKTGKAVPEAKASAASALVVQRADMEMSEGKVQVTDNGDNTLTVKNLTKETIPTVRVFYKYYMDEEELFVGGIAFTLRISGLGAGASMTVQPSHYTSTSSRVVMVLTYDSEV